LILTSGLKLQVASAESQAASAEQQDTMKLPKQYYAYVYYYYLYPHKSLPKSYVLKWKKYLDDNFQMEKYYSFFSKQEWRRKLKELPEYHKFILNAERQASSSKRQVTSSGNNRK